MPSERAVVTQPGLGLGVGTVLFDDSPSTHAGFVLDHGTASVPTPSDGSIRVQGDSRVYLVRDPSRRMWDEHTYIRLDLSKGFSFTVDLSNVPTGCLACVYLVAMPDPTDGWSQYCDMAENVRPGLDGEKCIEIDLLEANSVAMQAAIHTETDGEFGSGRCDRNGCFSHVGGPKAPDEFQAQYGPGSQTIDSHLPFELSAQVDSIGALSVTLSQGGRSFTSFDRCVLCAVCVCVCVCVCVSFALMSTCGAWHPCAK